MKPLSQYSRDDLIDRLQGLAKNLFLANGRLYMPSTVRDAFWETHAEVKRRGAIPTLDVQDLIQPSDPAPIFHDEEIVRYASFKRLEELIAGKVSFGPAALYDFLPNSAQNDNELMRAWREPDCVLEIGGISYPSTDWEERSHFSEDPSQGSQYHLLSFAYEESPKLQRAFGADGYVIVHDCHLFFVALDQAVRKSGAELWRRRVDYFDDRSEPRLTTQVDFVFSKCLTFQFQREVRFVVVGAAEPSKRFEVEVSWPSGLFSPIRRF